MDIDTYINKMCWIIGLGTTLMTLAFIVTLLIVYL